MQNVSFLMTGLNYISITIKNGYRSLSFFLLNDIISKPPFLLKRRNEMSLPSILNDMPTLAETSIRDNVPNDPPLSKCINEYCKEEM